MIRITITIFILLFISGCAVASKDIFDITRTQLFGYPQEEVTSETISDSNYSFMIAKLGRGREIKLILNSAKDDLFEWISSDDERIYTYKGLIIRTLNLEHNVDIKEYNDFLNTTPHQSFLLNFDNPSLISAKIDLNISPIDKTKISNIYGKLNAYQLEKNIDGINWRHVGMLWIDKNNRVVESNQEFHPFMDEITFKIYLKYQKKGT